MIALVSELYYFISYNLIKGCSVSGGASNSDGCCRLLKLRASWFISAVISLAGLRHTLGLMSRRNVKAEEDADVVILLKEAGGILIAVTNIPEYNLWVETRNNVYGQTLNPYNTTRTVGGSSGGEVRRTEYSKTVLI